MFWLAETAGKAAEHVEQAEEHSPIIVQLVNHYFGKRVYEFEMSYTYPKWKWLLAKFGSTPEAAFGPYSPDNAIPWYTVMFLIACVLSVMIVWILKGQLSEKEPGHGQQTLEVGVLAVRAMLEDIVGPHGLQYFPVVMTFAVLILVSNLMGLFPLFLSPTAAVSVTFALGLSSFLYYNSLGIRLLGNLFADEKVVHTVSQLAPPWTWVAPLFLMPLSIFVAFIQTFVFILLSQLYLSEVSHESHEEHEEHDEHEVHRGVSEPGHGQLDEAVVTAS